MGYSRHVGIPPPRPIVFTAPWRQDPLSPLNQDVYCSSYIGHSDIAGFLRNNSGRLSEKNRQLLQEALTLVTNESSWVWENAQLTVLGTHFTQQMRVVFYSGDRTNQYVVHLTSQDRPAYVVENRGWRLKARDAAKTCWGWIKSAASTVVGAVTGGFMRAIGW
ncbi:uncharacterized protein LOC144914367 isoform X2 [Branchiostoma floridae x Branchiostoma belcheri]